MIDLTPTTRRVAALVDHIDDADLTRPTPNDGMDVAALLHHLLGLSVAFRDAAGKVDGPTTNTPPDPAADVGPLPETWRADLGDRLGELAEAWAAPAAWEGMTTAGGVTFPAEACGLVALDEVLLHGWDLATAIGADYEPSTAEAEAVLPIVTPSGDAEADAQARAGMFGTARTVPDGASPFERTLALSGRDPAWRP